MKAYELGPQTGLESLTPTTRPDPVAGYGEVVLKVRLVALNNRDIQVLEGRYGAKKAENRIPVSEGVGEVVQVGEGVTSVALGDRAVFAHFANWIDGDFALNNFGTDYGITHDGWLAEYIKVPGAALVKVPDSLSDEQVAPLASSALTAWHAVVEVGKVKAGDTVLALGTGGVAIWALQIAKAAGAKVVITSSSDEKLELARKLGADVTINYRKTPDWASEVQKATGGADIIVETGGTGTQAQSVLAAAANGRIVFISVAPAEGAPAPNVGLIIYKNLVLKGIAEGSRAMLARLLRAIELHQIQPVIDSTFTFDDVPAAYAYLKSGSHVGKVLIRVAD
ncbi:NAD(P)-dependent alcohol dehydrogenase [Novosphingobium umbonatum]|uniref:NAD(P)-dependent alcohol dehydrogenase n=1 Tax=Novosphingobium umbonatum TaxID=1908524 RepID=A0A3S2VVL3_9SPHN|nr:NAD(P)-dependent alcohol dehydrogenase [Novosphingobium umbonatum]RVU06914.1 NAD(P)-dependent alcohol dehydrogenase [Novosphingobium umbonatum]